MLTFNFDVQKKLYQAIHMLIISA
uniref:Uncharacterized protein n=1 Tax=Rhizophora mucronata TaxID=61149 RepID=A0A2P2NB77_RHIMU